MISFFSKKRCYAFLIHALFSVVLLGIALFYVYGIWYPNTLAVAMGVGTLYLMMLAIDIILGPVLTFIIYKENRKKLFFDMSVILILQLSAYAFGLHVMHAGKPAWLVFVVDDIELVSPIDLRKTQDYKIKDDFKTMLWHKPQWVAAVYSSDPIKMQQQKEDEMFNGINISTRPETYEKIQVKAHAIVSRLKPTAELGKFNHKADIKKQLSPYHNVKGWLPVKAPEVDMVALFDEHGQPIDIVNLRPWD